MPTRLKLLHLLRHSRLSPFLVGARNGGFVSYELIELATNRGRIVVAGDFAFDFVKGNVTVVTFVGLGRIRGSGFWVDIFFVGFFGGLGGFGVRFYTVGGGGVGAAGAARCFGHCGGFAGMFT